MISTLLTTQLILAASSVVRAAVFFDPTAVKHSCVADDGSTLTPGAPLHLPDVNTTAEEQTILLKPIRPTTPISGLAEGTSAMCVFHRWTLPLEDKDSKKGFYFPLGRSVPSVPAEVYGNITSGYGDWTRPPGKASRQLEYVCGEAGNAGENFEAGEYLCEVTLPTSSHQHPKNPVELVHNDLPYYLTYYQRSMTVRNELSRFLQTNTFGPTQTELNTLEATFVQLQNEGYTHAEAMSKLQRDWIQAQMDPSTFTTGEFSSLRKYWRRRLNPRKIETYRIGESGPHPCETNSRWRKFAFTNYDAQLSKGMRWGTQELGGSYQTAPGHKITVETVEYYGSADIDAGGTPAPITGSPTSSPVAIPSSTLGPTSLASTITTVPLPTGPNLLPFGDMEGTEAQLKNMWPSGCARSLVLKTDSPDLVAEGSSSLHVTGGTKCFLFRPIGLGCTNRRVAEPINAGDTIKISLKVRLDTAGQVFQMYTGHYHTDKLPRGWGLPEDDSYMISRTKIPNADEWTTIDVIHKIGDDWKKGGMMLTPQGCNHYQLRFRVANSAASYYLDDVSVSKISPSSDTNSTDISVPKSGFFTNPGFEMDHQYWKTAATSGYITNDAQLKHNVMVMKRGQALRQNVMDNAVLGQQYQFGFNIKLANVDAIKMRIILRMKFTNNDLQNGPCPKHTCNFYKRPLVKSIRSSGGEWQHVVTEKFDMFDDFMDWSQYGTVDFILFEMNTRDMDAGGEYRVADFAMMDEDYTTAPSLSLVPSSAPTNLIQTHIGYIVRYAGEIRTVVRHPFQVDATGEVLPMDGTDEYELCEVDEVEGRKAEFPNRMNFVVNGRCSSIRGGNPTIDLDPNFVNQTNVHVLDLSNQTVTPINAEQTYGGDLLLETGVQDEEVCAALPTPYDNDYRGGDPYNPDTLPSRFEPDKPVFAKLPGGTYALFDSRLLLHENTLENPLMDGGATSVLRSTIRAQNEGLKTKPYPWNDNEYFMINDQNIALCLNEQPNWLNHDSCVLSYEENVCVKEYVDTTRTLNDVQLVITFDDETLSNFHNATLASFAETGIDNSRYFYAVGNLRWDDSVVEGNITELPCTPLINPVSRWKPRSDLDASTCSNTIAAKSITVLKHALETSNDENPYLRDVYLWNGLEEDGCDEADYDAYGMLIMTNEGCWENVHPDHMSIYDFTGSEAEQNWATAGGILEFPDSLPVSQFEELKEEWGKIQAVDRYHYASSSRVNQGARYGDTIILDQFAEQMLLNNDPVILKSIADNFAVITLANKVATNRGGGTLVCGSPNEVAPDPTLDDYFDVIHRDLACIGCQESYGAYEKQKSTVWAMAVLEGEDQLCQRMAWSLYELLNVGTASNPDNTESNLFTYDIHLRHCFGNYFDVLKEMTFNSKMSEQFNFVDSTSTRITWETSGALVYPDENYGREVMQLFTIGLHELNPDGTETRDEHGRVIQTYTNFDILSNSRIMTGFTFTARRGNVEELFRSEKSRLDPLRIEVDKHDFFPKTSVDGNWIGDRYPLCVDLPEYHFLKIGAVYKFRGGSSLPMAHYNPPHWDSDESIKRFVLDPSSGLYQQLCNPGADGSCNFSQTVTLDSNLACYSKECRIDDLEVVQVAPGAFYEYIRQPCVNLSFYPTPKKVITGFSPWVRQVGRRHTHAMCADPRTAVAARSCCGASEPNKAVYNYDLEYHGERVEFSTSLNQCTADSGTLCDPSSMIADNPLVEIRPVYNYPYPSQNTFFWTAADCALSVKVRDDGMIAIIHDPASNPWFSDETVPYVDLVNTRNYISVTWEKDPMTFIDMYPSLSNTCGSGACSITSDDACLCPVTLNEVPVYNSLPSRKEVLSLKIGAIDPDTFSDATVTYSLLESSDDVEAHVSSDSGAIGSTSTIFKVTDEYGEIIFLKNMISTITLGNYEIRNPPSFMNLVKVELRDAEYEVDAFLMHLIRYPSAAPFICKKLVQYHHGISNPSPGFVQRVAQAFISGSFTSGGVTFGTDGKYGDLKAVAAAIALDPESLSAVIDEDPVSGNIREPLLKVMQFMRSLSFKRRPHVKFRHGLFDEIHYKIGQMVFDPPDQFSFFSSDYSPPGAFAEAELFSPESELLSMSAVVGMVNGLFSFVNYGLTHIDGGFGPSLRSLAPVGDYSTSVGHLTFPFQTNNGAPVTSTIDELSTMLTAGRLSSANKQVLVNAHAYFNENYGIDFADRVVLKLMATTSEFHTSNTLRKNGSFSRSTTPPSAKSSSPYKAIVYINLAGGADSFNILTPGSTDCTSLYDEYWEARGRGGGIGLKSDQIFDIDGSSAEISGCSNLGVTTLLPAYKDIFNEGKGVFFANMGHLHKHVTRENWLSETHTDLFSHHTMRLESHVVDAFREGEGPGVLGRMLDILETHGHAVGATSTNSRATIIDGSPTTGRLADIMPKEGMTRVHDRNFLKGEDRQLRAFLEEIHAETDDNSGIFGNAWSQSFVDLWNKTDSLVTTVRSTVLATSFPTPQRLDVGGISTQLQLIAQLINARNERGNGINRDVFYCEMGGYDAHFKVNTVMENKLPSLNHAVATFWAEIKAQGLADNVVVVQGSEFGRTITPNSNTGSDHAWGGNYFMFGGDVKGGKIKGEYPKSFSASDSTNIGRGRLLPTTSWDALFYALTQWMGITDQDEIDYVLPNNQNFGCNLFTDYDLFNTGQQVLNGCGGATLTTPITFQVPDIRMLTGEEQKGVCQLAVRSLSNQLGFIRSKARCYVSDMTIVMSETSPGNYDVNGNAVLNFDGAVISSTVTQDKVEWVSKAAAATASDFVVLRAIPQSESPSQMPSIQPSTSLKPSISPSMSSGPSKQIKPSASPSFSPSVALTSEPTDDPTFAPTLSIEPTNSHVPTPGLTTVRHVFDEDFTSMDIGDLGVTGESEETSPGLYTALGSGADIWGTSDSFHYMHLETSGDVTLTVLVEGFEAVHEWAKGGIMFRDSLSPTSSHYSMFQTKGNGLANQYRTCSEDCDSDHSGVSGSYSSIWLRVTKVGNVFSAFYRSTTSTSWEGYGVVRSMPEISSNGYYIGIAVTSHVNTELATLQVSNIQLTRSCSSGSLTPLQCAQASNCEPGPVSGACYNQGEVPAWEYMDAVASIFDVGSITSTFGCTDVVASNNALDGTTNVYSCGRDNLEEPTGLLITPSHYRSSIAEGLRVYASTNCPNCDPVSYLIEGRADSNSDWVQISAGDLSWKTSTNFPRNGVFGLDITSSYTSGDESLSFTEISFIHDFDTLEEYFQYKITWTATRNPTELSWRLAEIEVPGFLGEEPAMPILDYDGDFVASVAHGSTAISILGGYSSGATIDQLALNGSTQKFFMYRAAVTDVPGIKISPLHNKMSVVTGLRIYTANNNANADPVKYQIEGRGMVTGANFKTRHSSKCWVVDSYSGGIGYRVSHAGSCVSDQNDQLFYMNELGEIQVKSLPGYCMDPRYGFSTTYQANYMVPCNSITHGPDSYEATWHQFTYDPSTEQFVSMFYEGYCVEYRTKSGWLSLKSCKDTNQQKFYTDGGSIESGSGGWSLIDGGNLPWISENDRNPLGVEIESSYQSGDTGKYFIEVKFYGSTTPYFEYKVLFPEMRGQDSLNLQFAELELPGLVVLSSYSHSIVLGACEDFALMSGTAATCSGSEDCLIIDGYLGVSPAPVSSITGNFVGTIRTTAESAPCATDGMAALTEGIALGASVLATPIAAEIGGITFIPGIYKASTTLNIAAANLVYLNAQGDPHAEFIFVAGSTLTTGADVEIVLLNGAQADNVFWVLGTALIMGADSILAGNVLAGSTLTMGTNAQILMGRAITQSSVTCETACVVHSPQISI